MPAAMTMHYRVLQVVYTVSVDFKDHLHLYIFGQAWEAPHQWFAYNENVICWLCMFVWWWSSVRTQIHLGFGFKLSRLQNVNGWNVHHGSFSWPSVTWHEADAPTYLTVIDSSFKRERKTTNNSCGYSRPAFIDANRKAVLVLMVHASSYLNFSATKLTL